MPSKYISFIIISAIVLAGGSFYGGMTYQKTKTPATVRTGNQGQFGNWGNRGAFTAGGTGRNGGGMVGFVGGEILSKDANSLTIKLNDGGSKIVFYSTSTLISKMSTGTTDELAMGKDITVNGTANQDGSVSATMIQIRPQGIANTRPR